MPSLRTRTLIVRNGGYLAPMAHIVLFHHILGLTPGVRGLADAFVEAGHQVSTPDLFSGRTFPDIKAGLDHVNSLGDGALLSRAEQACAGLPVEVVYAGLSLGVVPAQHLLATRPGSRGALLIHAFVDPTQMGGTWPDGCPVGVFAMQDDPFFVGDGDLEAARLWGRSHPGLDIRLYPGAGHLFTEPAVQDYDPQAARDLIADALALLDRCDSA